MATFIAKRGSKNMRVGKATVKPSTFKIRNGDKPGRAPKLVEPLERGALDAPTDFNCSKGEKKQIVSRRAKIMDEKRWLKN